MKDGFRHGDKKITRSGTNSLSVVIPASVVRTNNLQAGDSCEVISPENNELLFVFKKPKAKNGRK